MLATSRLKAPRHKPRLLYVVVGACLAVLGLSAAPALGARPPAAPAPVPGTGSPAAPIGAAPASGAAAAPVGCAGQAFSQPFASLSDSNYYTLVQGGEFNDAGEGWELYNGAAIIPAPRPSGAIGGVLDLRSGSVAVSPPVCVTLQYPAARVWVRDVKGTEGVAVAVVYLSARAFTQPQTVGELHGGQGAWTLSNPISVQPQIAGASESGREARFVFAGSGRTSESQLSGLWVDPRMR